MFEVCWTSIWKFPSGVAELYLDWLIRADPPPDNWIVLMAASIFSQECCHQTDDAD